VKADTLIAYYREKDGKSEIFRLDANGNTVISSPTEKVVGASATYDMDKAVLVVRGGGKPVVLTTQTDQVIANDTLEYWEHRRQAVARGGARAVRDKKQIQADTLTGEFKEGDKGALVLATSQAFGNVLLTTPTEVVTGERGHYNLETGIATLTGSVKITRSDNQLNGGYAQVNLNTGISQLFAQPPGQAAQPGQRQRVQGLFVPERKDQKNEPQEQSPENRR
jgi:lipopolysaccharide export system protein LptA